MICSYMSMERIDPSLIADALLTSAGWARIGLTAPDEHLREQAAKELAITICETISPSSKPDPRQSNLPF